MPLTTEGSHTPTYTHKHNGLSFDYPTMGVPVPGQTYNATPVESGDLAVFDQTINNLFKPYNVLRPLLRTPTASLHGTARTATAAT